MGRKSNPLLVNMVNISTSLEDRITITKVYKLNNITYSPVREIMKILEDKNVITREKKGREVIYHITDKGKKFIKSMKFIREVLYEDV